MLDRRRTQRMRSLMAARIDFHKYWPTIDCAVRNLSKSGACVELQGDPNTPLEFSIVFTRNDEKRACRQVWRQGNRIGVVFEQAA
jgi:hypothetical protein